MSEEFATVADRIVEAVLAADPAVAAFVGDHRFDDRLPDRSAAGVAHEVAMLRDAADALSQVDGDVLAPEDRIDLQALLSLVDWLRFELTEVREQEWNPLVHNPGPLLYAILARPYAPAEVRLEHLAGRLTAVPDALAAARASLVDCPRIHLETAVGQFTGAGALIRQEVPGLLAEAPAQSGPVIAAADQATAALDDFVGWLRERLAEGRPGRDPRFGRPLWEARLWYDLDTELSAEEILRRAESTLDSVSEQLRLAAAELTGDPATDATVRVALDRLAEQHPDNESIVDLAKLTMAETTDFVREQGLVSLVDDPCVIREMPEFARGVAVAFCDPVGPLETGDVPTFYCIAPTPADWPAERVESFYREYNDHMIREMTVHEAMPGHYLQQAHARRYRGSSRARAVTFSGPFVEGWAVYAEQFMVEHGFGGLPLRLQQLKMQLRMAINAIIDQLVHCAEMSEADAMALMRDRGFQEEGEAAGKWRRALLTSTQLSTYFVGYSEVSAIGAARPADVPLRQWHDRMLAHGSVAPRHLRTLLGV